MKISSIIEAEQTDDTRSFNFAPEKLKNRIAALNAPLSYDTVDDPTLAEPLKPSSRYIDPTARRARGARSSRAEYDDATRNKLATGARNRVNDYVQYFKQDAAKHGYDADVTVDTKANGKIKGIGVRIITKENNIPIAISLGSTGKSPNIYMKTPTEKSNPDARKNIISTLQSAGFTLGSITGKTNADLSIKLNNDADVKKDLEQYWNLVDTVEEMGSDFATVSRGSGAGKLINQAMSNSDYYMGAAAIIYVAVKFGLRHLVSRGGKNGGSGTFDINDRLLVAGQTRAAHDISHDIQEGTLYREHAVPSNVIVKEAIKMFQARGGELTSANLADVAEMIRRNLIIVICSTEQANELDKVHKDTMPASWDPITGNPLQRFIDAEISVYPITGGKSRITEKRTSVI